MKRILLAAIAVFALALPAEAQQMGGFDTGTMPVQPATPSSSSHSAGQSVGGLFQLPVSRVAGNSGEIENLLWISSGGDITAKQVRLWDVKPTVGTTCTDGIAYVSNATDDAHLLLPPFTITPAAPTNTTGDAKTYASYTFGPPISWRNQDSSATKLVYGCVVTEATDTADESAAVYLDITGPQN